MSQQKFRKSSKNALDPNMGEHGCQHIGVCDNTKGH